MPFQNPIVGGTTLVRTAINSPGYTPGSVGWSINRDGSAEFNNATLRGSLTVNAPPHQTQWSTTIPAVLTTFYNATLSAFYAVRQSFVNATDYYYELFGASVSVTPAPTIVTGWVVAGVVWEKDGIGIDTTNPQARAMQWGNYASAVAHTGKPWGIQFFGVNDPTFAGQAFDQLANGYTQFDIALADFSLDGRSQPRGLVDQLSSVANSAAIGTVETVLYTGNNVTFPNARAFELRTGQFWLSSVASGNAVLRVRRHNIAGTVLYQVNVGNILSGAAPLDWRENANLLWKNASGADITDTWVLTVQSNAGAGTTVTALAPAVGPRYARIYDAGWAGDFSNLVQM